MTERKARAKAKANAKARTAAKAAGVLFGGGVLEGWIEVFPGGVDLLDESYLIGAGEALEFLLAGYGAADVAEVFEVDETMDGVAGGVGSGDVGAVRCCSLDELVCHADVEIARAAGEDVDPEVVLAVGHGEDGSRVVWLWVVSAATEADPLRG